MALKTYKELDNLVWKTLEELNSYPEEELYCHNLTYDCRNTIPNVIKVKKKYNSKVSRFYCKCGYVSSDIEKSACPVCGNKNSIYFEENYSWSSRSFIKNLCDRYYLEPISNGVELKHSSYNFFEDVASSTFKLEKTVDEVCYRFTNTKAEKVEGGSRNTKLEELEPFHLAYFDEFKEFVKNTTKNEYGAGPVSPNIESYYHFVNNKKDLPLIFSKNLCDKYPNLLYDLSTYLFSLKKSAHYSSSVSRDDAVRILEKLVKNEDDFIEKFLCLKNLDFIPYLNKLYARYNNIARYNYSSVMKSNSPEVYYRAFFNISALSPNLQNAIYIMAMHSNRFYMSKLNILIGDIISECFSNEMQEVLASYIKLNYAIEGEYILISFKRDKDFLEKNGLEVNSTNIEKRTLNLYKNVEGLKNNGYNEKKVSYFLELFDLNPLESLSALKTRRAPSKKLLEELSKKLD